MQLTFSYTLKTRGRLNWLSEIKRQIRNNEFLSLDVIQQIVDTNHFYFKDNETHELFRSKTSNLDIDDNYRTVFASYLANRSGEIFILTEIDYFAISFRVTNADYTDETPKNDLLGSEWITLQLNFIIPRISYFIFNNVIDSLANEISKFELVEFEDKVPITLEWLFQALQEEVPSIQYDNVQTDVENGLFSLHLNSAQFGLYTYSINQLLDSELLTQSLFSSVDQEQYQFKGVIKFETISYVFSFTV